MSLLLAVLTWLVLSLPLAVVTGRRLARVRGKI